MKQVVIKKNGKACNLDNVLGGYSGFLSGCQYQRYEFFAHYTHDFYHFVDKTSVLDIKVGTNLTKNT